MAKGTRKVIAGKDKKKKRALALGTPEAGEPQAGDSGHEAIKGRPNAPFVGSWKRVDVGNDLLLGAAEDGFMGLEVLDGSVVIATASASAAANPVTAPKTKKRKGLERQSCDAEAAALKVDGASNTAIQAELERLRQENARLQGLVAGSGATSAEVAGGKQKKKKKKAKLHAAATTAGNAADLGSTLGSSSREATARDAGGAPGVRVDVSAWDVFELQPGIMAALACNGFERPTAIQEQCLPAACKGRCDIIGAAQTGSGKTLAFGLPIIQFLLDERARRQQDDVAAADLAADTDHTAAAGAHSTADDSQSDIGQLRALILEPTRELALQVCDHLQSIAKPNNLWVVPLVGGISQQKQERLLRKQPQVVVATPGRLWDLMQQQHAHLTNLSGLNFLVLDEADHMMQLGHFQELSGIFDAVPFPNKEHFLKAAAAKDKRRNKQSKEDPDIIDDVASHHSRGKQRKQLIQVFVFSATLTLPAALRQRVRAGRGGASGSSSLETLMDRIPFRAKPRIVDLTEDRKVATKVLEAYIDCTADSKDELLYYLLAVHDGRTLVFANAISAVRRIAAILKLLGLPVFPLHASMQQRQRLKYLDRFRSSSNGVLIASDVAARGLDVKDVRCVIHYQIPASPDVYVHRCGRTARADRDGISIALVAPADSSRFASLFKAFKRPLPDAFPVDVRLLPKAHQRVRLAARLDEATRLSTKQSKDKHWQRRTAEQLGIELPDDEEHSGLDLEVDAAGQAHALRRGQEASKGALRGPSDQQIAQQLQQELTSLLQQPLTPSFNSNFFTGGQATKLVTALPNKGRRPAAGEKQQALDAVAQSAAIQSATDMQEETVRAAAHAASAAVKVAMQQTHVAGTTHVSIPQRNKAGKHLSLAQQRLFALQSVLKKKKTTGTGKKQRRVVVVPESLGRGSGGQDALTALKRHVAAAEG